jgi:DNA polymerase-3 subunit gamma/tau
MVRYLRNALMAKLGGDQTELLQISGDERARAARTALLFTEEELTRNLQIVLRTFDDLNYRQEQRFHLELGLLKLIHAQRLLPIEELLSGAGARNTTPAQVSRPTVNTQRAAQSAPSPQQLAVSASPFGSGSSWGAQPSSKQSAADTVPIAETAPEVTSSVRQVTPFPVASSSIVSSQRFGSAEALTEGALARVPEPADAQGPPPGRIAPPAAAQGTPDPDSLSRAICAALTNAGHLSAAQLLGTGTWTLETTSLRIEVPGMGKKMLALTINAAAEKIIRQELQRLGAPTRFFVVPGEGAAAANGQIDVAPLAGSVQEAALANPLVQRAKEIFKAEVRSVVDLRQK